MNIMVHVNVYVMQGPCGWTDGRWANIMRVRSTDRNASLCSVFAEQKKMKQIVIQGPCGCSEGNDKVLMV